MNRLLNALGLMTRESMLNLRPLLPQAPHHMGQTRYTCGYKPARSRYMPHQGDREIARRKRQMDRDRKKGKVA